MKHRIQVLRSMLLPLLIVAILLVAACCGDPGKLTSPISTDGSGELTERAKPGETIVTHVHCPENGNIAVRVDLPQRARYKEGAPIAVVASTWFVEKYTDDEVGFHLVYNPVDIGAIAISNLWPVSAKVKGAQGV